MRKEPFITVFTPTYNRMRTLRHVYESLLAQIFRNFEWLIVDDGSTDGTKDLVRKWQEDASVWFPIRYYWQPNQHKKVAHNRAVLQANGELFVVFDSDDRCFPEALDRFAVRWQSVPEDSRSEFAGVCALCIKEDGSLVGDAFPAEDWIDSDSLEMRYRFKVRGEKWGAMRTDVLKMYPFPEGIEGYVPEAMVWARISARYKVRYFNETLRIYCQGDHLQISTGLCSRKAPGMIHWKRQILTEEMKWFWHAPARFLLDAAGLVRYRLHRGRSGDGFWPGTRSGRTLVLLAAPAGLLWWLLDLRAQSRASFPANRTTGP